VLQSLLEDAGLGQRQSMVAARVGEGGDLSIDNIKTALSLVMGPVGNMIFNDIASRVGDSGDLQQLVSLIANEIGEEKKISLFQQHLRT
jgi:hypothetical protein